MKRLASTAVAALYLTQTMPALGWEDRAAFGRALCLKGAQGILPNINAAKLRDILAPASLSADDLCTCAGAAFADVGAEAEAALRADMRKGFQNSTRFDDYIIANLQICAQLEEGEGDFSLGDAAIAHGLNCEIVLSGDLPIAGFSPQRFAAMMRKKSISPEQMCGCSVSYYIDNIDTIVADIERSPETGYDKHMLISLESCQKLNANWPEITSDPALDPDMAAKDLCLAAASGGLELSGFDYGAQVAWEEGSGLGPHELCQCTEAQLDSPDIQYDIASAPDHQAALTSAVVHMTQECRRFMWTP